MTCLCGDVFHAPGDEAACDVCGVPLHLGLTKDSPTCILCCPAGLCEGAFCRDCVTMHVHRVEVQGPFFPRWRNLLSSTIEESMRVELRGMECHKKTRARDNGDKGYVCIKVHEARVAGLKLTFDDAHISLVDVRLTACTEHRELSTKERAAALFDEKVDQVDKFFPRSAEGRMTWNGLTGGTCCLELRNDSLGLTVARAVSAFNIFPVEEGWSRRTLPWLPGRNLHLSLNGGFSIAREQLEISWVHVRYALGLQWE